MNLSALVAMSPAGLIGRAGTLPWPRVPGDMRRFRERTMGCPVIMGHRTWRSLPNRPLEGRDNIVLTRDEHIVRCCPPEPRTSFASDLGWAVWAAVERNYPEAFIIGGREVYAAALPHCSRLFVTRVPFDGGDPQPGDVYWPGKLPWEDGAWVGKRVTIELATGVEYMEFERVA